MSPECPTVSPARPRSGTDVARQDRCQKPGKRNGAPRAESLAPEFGCGLARLASPPDDAAYLIGVEGPHRVCADVADRPYLEQAHRPRFIVGELAHGDDVVLANRPEQLTYPSARALDELREILRALRGVLVVLYALLGPVDQRHISWHARTPFVLADFKTIVCPGKHRGQGRSDVLLSASSQIRNADRGWRSQVCDLELRRGAGDGNRTRTVSLGTGLSRAP